MAATVVNPTRMELTRLKGKLKTSIRGHKLLKDKRDELMKQFLDTVREVRELRNQVETELMKVHGSFTVASALMSGPAMEQALMYPKQSVELDMTFKNVMSVSVPTYHFKTKTEDSSDIFPYGYANTSGELDAAVEALGTVFQSMLKLAQIEKTAQLLAEEIEKTRRRVNALEYVVIPQTRENIRYITMKLDENDRANTIRLMKVHGSFTVASALMSGAAMEQALMYPKQSVELDMTFKNVMSVSVPTYHYKTRTDDSGDIFPYGFANTSGELDSAVESLGTVFQSMLKLAQIEKTAQLLAEEIEKTRRRVNALEYVVIPNTRESIRYITMKLDENDRSTTTRLMKVKDMILKQAQEEQRARDAEALQNFQ